MKEKNEFVVGIVSSKKMKKKNISPAREFWQPLVKIFFDFCEQQFGAKPSFDGASAKSMGLIIDSIAQRCKEKDIEWTEDIACRSWKLFLITAHEDRWLQENFILTNLNKFKDKVFFKLSKISKDGTAKNEFSRDGVSDELKRRNYNNREL